MQLRLHTDYALRALMYLAYVERRATAEEIARAYGISKDHLVKVLQELARHGWVRTTAGRHGGVSLVEPASRINVAEVVEAMEGRPGLLECIPNPTVCPVEPGCRLRALLIDAEQAFYESLATATVADMLPRRGTQGGLRNLSFG